MNTVHFLEITITPPQQHKMFMVVALQCFHMYSGKSAKTTTLFL